MHMHTYSSHTLIHAELQPAPCALRPVPVPTQGGGAPLLSARMAPTATAPTAAAHAAATLASAAAQPSRSQPPLPGPRPTDPTEADAPTSAPEDSYWLTPPGHSVGGEGAPSGGSPPGSGAGNNGDGGDGGGGDGGGVGQRGAPPCCDGGDRSRQSPAPATPAAPAAPAPVTNPWHLLWASTAPCPAWEQRLLQDPVLEGERVLHDLVSAQCISGQQPEQGLDTFGVELGFN